jgi:hypothetical protein
VTDDRPDAVPGDRRAARRAHAAADPRGLPRPGAPARPGEGPGRADPPRRRGLVHPVGPARLGQDDPGEDHRQLHRPALRAVLRRHGGRGSGARDHQAGGGPPQVPGAGHHPVLRRDPPLQSRPAGRVPSLGRERHRHPHRGDDREPQFRGEFGPAVALPGVRAAAARPRGYRRARAPRAGRFRSGPGGPASRDGRRRRGAARAGSRRRRAARAPGARGGGGVPDGEQGAGGRERAVRAAPDHRRDHRRRPAEALREVRQVRRGALQPDLRLPQGGEGIGSGRRAVLAGAHAGGRRGSAVPGAPHRAHRGGGRLGYPGAGDRAVGGMPITQVARGRAGWPRRPCTTPH